MKSGRSVVADLNCLHSGAEVVRSDSVGVWVALEGPVIPKTQGPNHPYKNQGPDSGPSASSETGPSEGTWSSRDVFRHPFLQRGGLTPPAGGCRPSLCAVVALGFTATCVFLRTQNEFLEDQWLLFGPLQSLGLAKVSPGSM